MKMFIAFVLLVVGWSQHASGELPGIQMRLTKKGLDYGMNVAMTRVRREVLKMRMDQHGRNGKVEYWLSNFRISDVRFPQTQLRPISNVGVQASLRGISLNGGGHLRYSYSTGIFGIKVNGNVGFSISLRNVWTDVQVVFGKDGVGRPTIGLRKCVSGIGGVSVSFHGGGILGWIMNLFRGQIGNIAKGMLAPFLCQQVRGQVIANAASSLRGFPISLKIDNSVAVDYRLVSQPKYTNNYMDQFLKGQFQCLSKHWSDHLTPNTFPVNGDQSKMLYVWVTDYSLDTAGASYQSSGALSLTVQDWTVKIPDSRLADLLHIKTFIAMIPDLSKFFSKFGNCPVSVHAASYKAPRINIKSNGVHMHVYTQADFKMKQGDKIIPIFGCKVDLVAVVQPKVKGNSLSGTIASFDFNITITTSITGKIDLTPPKEMREIVMKVIVGAVNPALQKGFPLPKTREISFRYTNFKLYDGAIRVGTDLLLQNI